jgi:hypothetical protein
MPWSRTLSVFVVFPMALIPATASEPSDARGSLHLKISERINSGAPRPVPARVHLTDSAGQPILAPALPSYRDHFNCDGEVTLALDSGSYAYTIERGPEYQRATGSVEIQSGKTTEHQVTLSRTIDLAARGWYSGETHVHRPLEEMPILMRSEDLHVAPVLTMWNKTNTWKAKPLPQKLSVDAEPSRIFHVLAVEDERDGGALLYFNLTRPLDLSADSREFPSPVLHMHEALKQEGAWVDVEKPFWWDVPTWVATGKVRSIGIANNHMQRKSMMDNEAWGKPRDRAQFPGPRGNGFYSQSLYYRLLNCGLRIPPSAGSASGVLDNPVGYNRVYVHLDGPFSYEAWWNNLASGRSFVTNGPILQVQAGGHDPGHILRAPAGKTVTVTLDVKVRGNDPLEAIEVIKNGTVAQRLAGDAIRGEQPRLQPLVFDHSGWFLVRAITDFPGNFRFASTAPFYVEVGDSPHSIHRADVEFFLSWIDTRIASLNEDREHRLKTQEQKRSVLEPHREARRFFEGLLRTAG